MSKVVLLHLDALSHQYLERGWLPELASLLDNAGVVRLFPGLAYEGITASMMTGHPVKEHGVWVHFSRRQEPADWLVRLLSLIPHGFCRSDSCKSYGTIHGLPAKVAVKGLKLPSPGLPWWRFQYIPLPWLANFDFAIPRFQGITSYDDFGGQPTLARLAREHGLHTGEIFGEWEQVIIELPELLRKADFIFVHTLMELDHLGHTYGPESQEVRKYLTRIDKSLPKFLQDLIRDWGERLYILVFSDHGMCPITHHIDTRDLLNTAFGERDTLLFVDSTMLRVWTPPDRREMWLGRLRAVPGLHILSSEDRDILPPSRDVTGDLVAVSDIGGLLLPNYWQGDLPVKGMHGYPADDPWQTAFFSVFPTWPKMRIQDGYPEDVFTVAEQALMTNQSQDTL